MAEDNSYDLDNVPEDAQIAAEKMEFDPIDPSEMYQVEVSLVELRDNFFYREKADKKESASTIFDKYQFSFEFVVLDEKNEFYGRRMWDSAGLYFKPEGKRGPTKLYKIVAAATKKQRSWDECAEFAKDLKTFYTNLKSDVEGQQIKVAIENVTKENGEVRTKITTYNPIKKKLDPFIKEEQPDPKKKMKEEDIPF